MPNLKISELTAAGALNGVELVEVVKGGLNVQTTTQAIANLAGSGVTREFGRTFTDTLVFDKNEIFSTPFELTGNVVYELGSGGLVDEPSVYRQRFITDGTHSISFGSGFDFIYGIDNGEILEAGTYEIYFLYTNGSVVVNVPGVSAEDSGIVTLTAPPNFVAVADGENDIDLQWDDVNNESSYLVEFSLTGTGGWSTLSTPAAGATTSTQTGLNPGDTRFYRIKAIGDGVNFLDSPFSTASATTEDSGDVTAPTFTFLPASGNTVWPVNQPIIITANEGIQNTDGSAITDANVATRLTLKETNSGGTNIPFSASIDVSKTIITITPTTIYGDTQLVYVAINNVEDVTGNEVTVAISSTFTTTDFTLMNGSSNRLNFGDTLDSLFAANDTNFWLECTIKNHSMSGNRVLYGKTSLSDNQRSFYWFYNNTDVYFIWYSTVTGTQSRMIKWTGAIDGSEQVLVLRYDGSIDTNNGLDRLTLLVDGGTAGSKTLDTATGALGNIVNATSFLAVGILLDHIGTPVGTSYFSGEIKDVIIRSNAGATVELNVPIVRTGTDTSGNALNGTWV